MEYIMKSADNFRSHSHWSLEVKIITFSVIATFGAIIYFTFEEYIYSLIWILLILSAVFAACYTPRYVKIDNEAVTIKKLYGKVLIPLAGITAVESVSSDMIRGSIRNFGSGGFFGYLGNFRNTHLGTYTIYATDRKQLVLIITEKKKFVISCADPDKFAEVVQSKLK